MDILFFKIKQFRDSDTGIYEDKNYSHINISIFIIPNSFDLGFLKWFSIIGIWIACLTDVNISHHLSFVLCDYFVHYCIVIH